MRWSSVDRTGQDPLSSLLYTRGPFPLAAQVHGEGHAIVACPNTTIATVQQQPLQRSSSSNGDKSSNNSDNSSNHSDSSIGKPNQHENGFTRQTYFCPMDTSKLPRRGRAVAPSPFVALKAVFSNTSAPGNRSITAVRTVEQIVRGAPMRHQTNLTG
jgi:hypothetical protein